MSRAHARASSISRSGGLGALFRQHPTRLSFAIQQTLDATRNSKATQNAKLAAIRLFFSLASSLRYVFCFCFCFCLRNFSLSEQKQDWKRRHRRFECSLLKVNNGKLGENSFARRFEWNAQASVAKLSAFTCRMFHFWPQLSLLVSLLFCCATKQQKSGESLKSARETKQRQIRANKTQTTKHTQSGARRKVRYWFG